MSSAICFSLDRSKILSSCNGLRQNGFLWIHNNLMTCLVIWWYFKPTPRSPGHGTFILLATAM